MRSATKNHVGKDPQYLTWLCSQPCMLCALHGLRQLLATESAHTGARGLSQKAPDRGAIPLCAKHHRWGPDSQHRMGKRFWDHHGIDRERVVSNLNKQFQEEVCEWVNSKNVTATSK